MQQIKTNTSRLARPARPGSEQDVRPCPVRNYFGPKGFPKCLPSSSSCSSSALLPPPFFLLLLLLLLLVLILLLLLLILLPFPSSTPYCFNFAFVKRNEKLVLRTVERCPTCFFFVFDAAVRPDQNSDVKMQTFSCSSRTPMSKCKLFRVRPVSRCQNANYFVFVFF